MDNNEITEIDFSTIDWNKLSNDEFSLLNKAFIQRQKLNKVVARPVGSKIKMVSVKVTGIAYSIPETVYIRLKNCKSIGIKNKIIDEIKTNYPVIGDL